MGIKPTFFICKVNKEITTNKTLGQQGSRVQTQEKIKYIYQEKVGFIPPPPPSPQQNFLT